jgi:hypothetical protein
MLSNAAGNKLPHTQTLNQHTLRLLQSESAVALVLQPLQQWVLACIDAPQDIMPRHDAHHAAVCLHNRQQVDLQKSVTKRQRGKKSERVKNSVSGKQCDAAVSAVGAPLRALLLPHHHMCCQTAQGVNAVKVFMQALSSNSASTAASCCAQRQHCTVC